MVLFSQLFGLLFAAGRPEGFHTLRMRFLLRGGHGAAFAARDGGGSVRRRSGAGGAGWTATALLRALKRFDGPGQSIALGDQE
jgi:hypothetical protein